MNPTEYQRDPSMNPTEYHRSPSMNPTEYQRAAARTECDQAFAAKRMMANRVTVPTPVPNHPMNDYPTLIPVRVNHACLGISKEGGELLALVEKWIYYGILADGTIIPAAVRLDFKDELGDVLWYCAQLCNALDLDLGEVMQANINKLRARYPHQFAQEECVNRDKAKEARAVRHDDPKPGQWNDPNTPPADRSGS